MLRQNNLQEVGVAQKIRKPQTEAMLPNKTNPWTPRTGAEAAVVKPPAPYRESRDLKYGLQTSCPVRQNRRNIDYCKLNDGLEESPARSPSPKRSRKSPIPARSGPSNMRMSAQSSPPPKPSPTRNKNKLIGVDKLTGAMSGDGASELVGGTDVTPKSPS